MIKTITVINNRDESLVLDMYNPYDNGLIIKDITGIGPAKANINTTELATSDGSIFNSARVTSRNIVFSLQLLPSPIDNLVETTRQLTYKYFPLKKRLTLIFETDNRISMIHGYVESNEPNIFQKEETLQISIVCPNPYFYAEDDSMVLNGIESLFYFPFSNESLTDDLLYLGNIVSSVGSEYYYDGDVDSGVIIHIHINDHVRNISIYNTETKERMEINTTVIQAITKSSQADLIAGDDIYLSTIGGDRYIYLIRDGVQYNILSAIPKITDWIKVVKGSNIFGYVAEIGSSNMIVEINTNILYEGV